MLKEGHGVRRETLGLVRTLPPPPRTMAQGVLSLSPNSTTLKGQLSWWFLPGSEGRACGRGVFVQS